MAYMQRVRLTKDSNLDDDTTWRYKLPAVGKFTAFEMVINCNRHIQRTAHLTVQTLLEQVARIELLAGGAKALMSLTGLQLDAMNYWDFKRPNARRYRQEEHTDNINHLFLMGGRDLYDLDYGWDMSKLGETYLEYTYNLQEGTDEYFEADDHDVSLYGWRWMGPGEPSFQGYFRSRQIAAWTTVASAIKTIAIPVGNYVRRVAVQSKTRARTIGSAFSGLEIRANEGEFSPVVVKSPMAWVMSEVQAYGLHNVCGGIDYAVDGQISDVPTFFSYITDMQVSTYGTLALVVTPYGFITLPPRIRENAMTGTEAVFSQKGYGFQKCLRIGFDHEESGYDLLDARQLGSLDLICTAANADRAVAAFVQDVVKY